MRRLIDSYFKKPIAWDTSFILVLYFLSPLFSTLLLKVGLPLIKIPSKESQVNYFEYLSSASVTFAGFIIAALTIIISVKSSLQARGFETANNALEYLFSTKHYESVVKVFIGSVVELVLFFVILYAVWYLDDNIDIKFSFKVILLCTIAIVAAVFRSLFILFKILHLEFLKRRITRSSPT